jgi:hypothetical protein
MTVSGKLATSNIPDDLLFKVRKISKEKSKTGAMATAMASCVSNGKMT